jgi:hypothetical protein
MVSIQSRIGSMENFSHIHISDQHCLIIWRLPCCPPMAHRLVWWLRTTNPSVTHTFSKHWQFHRMKKGQLITNDHLPEHMLVQASTHAKGQAYISLRKKDTHTSLRCTSLQHTTCIILILIFFQAADTLLIERAWLQCCKV